MFIYVIVCSETLKLYVGQHKGEKLQKYLQTKLSDAKHERRRSHLFNAMRKHSRETWSIHPLVSGVDSRQELDALEKHYIKALKSQHSDVGYNICDGGEGFTGPQSESAKRKISKRMKIVMLGNDHGKGNIGIPHPKDDAFRKRVSVTLTGRPKTAEHAKHIGDGHRGLIYHSTPESRARMAVMKGKHHSEEWKQNAAERMRGFKHSEEAKAKMRHPKSPEIIAKMCAAQQARRQQEKEILGE